MTPWSPGGGGVWGGAGGAGAAGGAALLEEVGEVSGSRLEMTGLLPLPVLSARC